MSKRRLRAILFDAGNTLIRINYAVIAAELARHGISVTAESIQEAEWLARVRLDAEVLARPEAERSTESQSAGRRYIEYVLDGLGVKEPATLAAMAEWRRTYNLPVGLWNTVDPEAEAALQLAREAGFAVAVISNSNGSVRSILESLGLGRYLDFVIDSFEVGVEKPDPRIFRLALERMGLEPGEAVYVGDLYSVDVLGARAVGLGAVLLDPGGCWGQRDCTIAPGVLAAVRLIVKG